MSSSKLKTIYQFLDEKQYFIRSYQAYCENGGNGCSKTNLILEITGHTMIMADVVMLAAVVVVWLWG